MDDKNVDTSSVDSSTSSTKAERAPSLKTSSSKNLVQFIDKVHKKRKADKQEKIEKIKEEKKEKKKFHIVRDEKQIAWESLSTWLQKFPLRSLTLPASLDISEHGGCPNTPVLGMDKNQILKKVTILKRFSSRKVPHLISFENEDGEEVKYIFKQDDDITMDVVIMQLFNMCNKIWDEARKKNPTLLGKLYTYEIIACPDKTGFGQIVPGDTMFNFHDKDIDNALGHDKHKWHSFYNSLISTVVVTAIFDITDRHHSNVMFTNDGTVALIDLSASLGLKAPMDSSLRINPVYLPQRLLNLHAYFNYLNKSEFHIFDHEMEHSDLEEDAITSYYAIYNNREVRKFLKMFKYKMLEPQLYLNFLHERGNGVQFKEGLRNNIVKKMDDSKTFGSFVAAVTSVIPMN